MDEPFLLMVAGPNGAGKTTLTRWLRRHGIDFGEYINPDDIADKLEGSYETRVAEAQAVADARREACIVAKRSFSFETVMSHPSKVEVLLRAKDAGFFVQLFFVGTDDPHTNVDRVALRVAQGGHDVPKDRTIAHWGRTMDLLHQAIRVSDRRMSSIIAALPRFLMVRGLSFGLTSEPMVGERPPNFLRFRVG